MNRKNSKLLWIAAALIFLFSLMSIGVDVDEYVQQREIRIPHWYFYIIGAIDFLQLLGIVLILLYRRIGVFLVPAAILAHFFSHIYYLNSFLYVDVMALFLYTGLGLLAIIPLWKDFR